MTLRIVISVLLGGGTLVAEERPDLLRFTNGDQLHGSFLGLEDGEQAIWKRDDLPEPVLFKTSGLRHAVLRGGRPAQALKSLSHIGMVGGDRFPGTISAIDADSITLVTDWAGTLKVPRNQVALLAPSPLGGHIHYHGPFSADGWRMAHPDYPKGPPDASVDADGESDQVPGRWEFSGAAWYWRGGQAGTALIYPDAMRDRAILRFSLAWKSRLNVAIAFHADCTVPPSDQEADPDEAPVIRRGDQSVMPLLFGNSYALQLFSSYMMLHRTSVEPDGTSKTERVRMNNSSLRLGESGKADVEIRSNRLSGLISLFIDGEFIVQWNQGSAAGDGEVPFAGKGGGFGFLVQDDESPMRISDIVVSDWNGMPDSARSLETDDQDVVLMTNGTDRFAGKIVGMEDPERVAFDGRYGRFSFPISEVAEIRFARSALATALDAPSDEVAIRMHPFGLVSGKAGSGDSEAVEITHRVLGPLRVSTSSAVMIEFNSSNQVIDDWHADF